MPPSKQGLKQLEFLKNCPKNLQKYLLKRIPASTIKTICECCLNVLKGNISLSSRQKKYLRLHKNTLRCLADKKSPICRKRKLIVQKGGFLNILIPAAISAISGLINGIH